MIANTSPTLNGMLIERAYGSYSSRGYEFLSFDLVLDVYRPANNFVSSISPSRIERFKVSLRSVIEQKQIRSL